MRDTRAPLRVRDLVRRDCLVSVHEDTPISELDKILASYHVGGVPVLSDAGALVGMVGQYDVVRWIARQLTDTSETHAELEAELRKQPVARVMSRRVHFVTPDDELVDAADAMCRLRLHRLLVVEDGEPIGMLSALDLLQVLQNFDFCSRFYRLESPEPRLTAAERS